MSYWSQVAPGLNIFAMIVVLIVIFVYAFATLCMLVGPLLSDGAADGSGVVFLIGLGLLVIGILGAIFLNPLLIQWGLWAWVGGAHG
jgi:hypothetical protein